MKISQKLLYLGALYLKLFDSYLSTVVGLTFSGDNSSKLIIFNPPAREIKLKIPSSVAEANDMLKHLINTNHIKNIVVKVSVTKITWEKNSLTSPFDFLYGFII